MNRLSKKSVVLGQKGEAALLGIAILPEFCHGVSQNYFADLRDKVTVT